MNHLNESKTKDISSNFKDWWNSLIIQKRKGDGIYFWEIDEIKELENIGFKRKGNSTEEPFYYIPSHSNEDLEKIIIQKKADITLTYPPEQADWFYDCSILFNGEGKVLHHDFDVFDKLIKFVDEIINKYDPLYKNIRKFNL